MRSVRTAQWAIAVAAALFGCSSTIEIRAKNTSGVTYYDVELYVLELGDLAPLESSPYRESEHAYRIANVSVRVEEPVEQVLELQPIDYVGETSFGPGRYTYEVGIEDTGLTLNVVED